MPETPAVDTLKLVENMPFDSSLEAIEVYEELERRRALVAEGKSRLLTEEECWASIRAAGYEI